MQRALWQLLSFLQQRKMEKTKMRKNQTKENIRKRFPVTKIKHLNHNPGKIFGEAFRWKNSELCPVVDEFIEAEKDFFRSLVFESLQNGGLIAYEPESQTWSHTLDFQPTDDTNDEGAHR